MGCGEEVGARRLVAQIENDRKVSMKSLHLCDSTAGCFFGSAAAIGSDGDEVVATRTEIWEDYVCVDHTTWKGPDRNSRCITTSSRTRLAEIDRDGYRSGHGNLGRRSYRMGAPVDHTSHDQEAKRDRRECRPSPVCRRAQGRRNSNFRSRRLFISKPTKLDQLTRTLGAL